MRAAGGGRGRAMEIDERRVEKAERLCGRLKSFCVHYIHPGVLGSPGASGVALVVVVAGRIAAAYYIN